MEPDHPRRSLGRPSVDQICRREIILGGYKIEKITNYRLTPDALVMVAESSIETQRKFHEKGYWYKQNSLSYEGTDLLGQPGKTGAGSRFLLKLNYRMLREKLQREPASGA